MSVGLGELEVGLGWLGELPAPTISGATAIYAEVLSGVDLRVTADGTGFSQVLVVKTPQAARDPRLQRVTFASHNRGVTVSATPDGRLAATDPTGQVVFTGDASRMWDSSGDATDADRSRGTGEGLRTATMGVEVTGSTLTIVPDQGFLTASSTVYPVYLDPSYHCTSCVKTHHNVVQSMFPTAHNFDRTDGVFGDLKAGFWCEPGDCPGINRTFISFNTSQLLGKVVKEATMHVTVVHSAQCGGATDTRLAFVRAMSQNTTWSDQPDVYRWLDSKNVTNNARYCPSAGGMELVATGGVADAVTAGFGETTFMLSGSSESNDSSWRRFGLNPYLVAKYNSRPNVPDRMGVDGWGPNAADAIPCAVGAARPFVASRTPQLRARVSDPDGGSLNAGFRVYRGTAGSHTWDKNETVDSGVPSGSYAEIRVPSGVMSDDAVYSWNLWASDGERSAWSGVCEFQVDTVVPGTPAVRSLQYPDGRPAGGVGQAGTFTITASTATNDTAYYLYGFTEEGGEPATKLTPSASNGLVTLPFNPTLSGSRTLSVRAVDRAGNRSAVVEYHVIVSDYQVGVSGKVAHWSLEDSPKDSAAAKDLTYQGPPSGAVYGTGHQGQGVVLDPDREEFYEAKDALVRTDTGFTVSAWAKLTRNDHSFTVAAQDGDVVSGFYLAYHKELDRWTFMMPDKDQVEEVQWYYAASAGPPVLGAWTHLVGVYDPATNRVRLYVNGLESEGGAAPTPWNATGRFTVGAAASDGKRIQYFPGAIDSVRAYPRALTATEVTALHAGTATANPTVEYRFEGNLVNSGADYDLVPKGSMTYGPGYSGRALNSGPTTQGWAESRGQVVHTTGSYSVAAWVKLADKAAHYHVASQDGTRISGFILRYAPDVDRWIFGMPTVDSDADTVQWAIGKTVPQVGVWTHLAAVHDVTQHKLLLYVNGVLEAEKDLASTIDAKGAFVVGQAKYLGGRTGVFKGSLDEVDAYDGALTAREVADLANLVVERARYRLDETSGRAAHDSVSGADASLYGASVTLGQNYGAASGNFTSSGTEHTGTVSGAGPLARWELNGGLTDASGNGWTLTHRNASGATAATYTTGRLGQGVVLNGVDQYLTAAQPLADTSGSYSVSAWVKPDRADTRSYTVATQNGATVPFQLRYAGDLNRWALTVTEPGGLNPRHAVSTLPPLPGHWTHLLGVVDVAAGKARLYVNGHLEGEASYTTAWVSTGYLTFGRAIKNGVGAEFFPGALDEVRLYGRALTAGDANGLWNLGSDITVPRPTEFRTDRSFTVAGWVRPAAYDTAARMAFSLGADRYSPLTIAYRPEWRRWVVEAVVGAEAGDSRQFIRVLSDNEASSYADTNGWVHLAAVYDGPAKQLRLYVNGVRQSTVPTSTTTWAKDPNAGSGLSMWDSGRDLQIGRLTYYGVPSNHWNGAIRDVRVFSGVLPDACDNAPICLLQLPWQ
ncbi:MAG: LamG domain-containing protein [Actinophytocola sp.]|uniref:LamG domain-containing protein n=1 Tax=Actinophytocola sp. TaxID=1872138 RepID=UPI003C740CA4